MSRRPGGPATLGYYRDPGGSVQAIKAGGGAGFSGGYTSDFIHYLARAPRELRADPYGLALAYYASVYAFQCTEVKARRVASVRWHVFERATKRHLDDENPLQDAFEWAYRKYQQNVLYLWAVSRTLWGETFIEPCTNLFGDLIGVRWLNPLGMEVYEGSSGFIEKFYYYDASGRPTVYRPDEIVFERRPNLLNDNRGAGRMQVALDAINVGRSNQMYVRAWFNNGAQPGVIFTPKEGQRIQPGDQQMITDAIQEDGQGVENWFAPLVMPIPMDATVVEAPKLSEQQVLKDDVRDEICNAIGVPRGLVDHNNAKYQLSDQQMIAFEDNEIVPECEDIGKAIDAQLMPFIDADLGFHFDLSKFRTRVDVLQKETALAHQQYEAGGISFHRFVEKIGEAKPQGEDFYLIPQGYTVLPVTQLHNAAAYLTQMQAPVPGIETSVQAPVVDADKAVDTTSLCIALRFRSHPDLIQLQGQAKRLYSNLAVDWNPPEDFHVTLLYAPACDEAQVEQAVLAAQRLDVPPLALTVGSLASFDNIGQHTVHFEIRRNAALLELQKALVEQLRALGIALSSFSDPALYKPHITMGYAASKPQRTTVHSKLTITPEALVVWSGEQTAYERPLDAEIPPDPEDELWTWRDYTVKRGVTKAVSKFTCEVLPEAVEAFVRDELQAIGDTALAKQVFVDAAGLLKTSSIKAYADTRAAFVRDMLRIIAAGQADETTRRKFAGEMRSALRQYGLAAFRDGMESEGYSPESFSEDELKVFRAWQTETSGYITRFGEEVFKQGITETEIAVRAEAWANKSLRDITFRGKLLAAPHKKKRWKRDPTKDSCKDCIARDGQVKTLKEWASIGLPGSSQLACFGSHCGCDLEDVE